MAFNVDASGFESETDAQTNSPKPGQYHVQVVKWDDSFEKTEAIIAEFVVLNGTTPGQAGKRHTEFFATGSKNEDPQKRAKGTEFCLQRIATCAMAAGALKPGERKAIEPADMLGHELVILLEEEVYNNKTRVRIPFCQMWPAHHADVADVPHGNVVDESDIPFDPADAVADL